MEILEAFTGFETANKYKVSEKKILWYNCFGFWEFLLLTILAGFELGWAGGVQGKRGHRLLHSPGEKEWKMCFISLIVVSLNSPGERGEEKYLLIPTNHCHHHLYHHTEKINLCSVAVQPTLLIIIICVITLKKYFCSVVVQPAPLTWTSLIILGWRSSSKHLSY